tara:strand:- start:645481 stop:646059 length:579 start_codon:yes stop_codon:yes gene_type:complete
MTENKKMEVLGSAGFALAFCTFVGAVSIDSHLIGEASGSYHTSKAPDQVNLLRLNMVLNESAKRLHVEGEYFNPAPSDILMSQYWGGAYNYERLGMELSDVFGAEAGMVESEAVSRYIDKAMNVDNVFGWRCFGGQVQAYYHGTALQDAWDFKDVMVDEYKEKLSRKALDHAFSVCDVSDDVKEMAKKLDII